MTFTPNHLLQDEENVMLAYCDYIAHLCRTTLQNNDAQNLIYSAGPVKIDLDPNGAFNSTTKRFEVTDVNGRKYIVTVEEQ
jgi:hypothetical protein